MGAAASEAANALSAPGPRTKSDKEWAQPRTMIGWSMPSSSVSRVRKMGGRRGCGTSDAAVGASESWRSASAAESVAMGTMAGLPVYKQRGRRGA